MDIYKSEKKSMSASVKAMDTLLKLPTPLELVNLQQDMDRIEKDSIKMERNTQFLKVRKTDIHLGETVNIINDMIRFSLLARKEEK
jgi:carboxyl-terminal processing protease